MQKEKKINKSNQVHIILHASLFFVKYILVSKYILNYRFEKKIKILTTKDVEEEDSKSRKIKITLTPQHTHTQSQAVGREEKKCTDHLKHKKTLWTLDHKQHETDRTDP